MRMFIYWEILWWACRADTHLKHPEKIKSLILTGSSGCLKTEWEIHTQNGVITIISKEKLN
jgi:hypothetical protein